MKQNGQFEGDNLPPPMAIRVRPTRSQCIEHMRESIFFKNMDNSPASADTKESIALELVAHTITLTFNSIHSHNK